MEPAAPGPLTGPPSWPSAPFGRQLPPPATACRPTEGDRWQRRRHQLPGRGGLFVTHVTGNLAILAAHLVTGSRTGVGLLLSVPAFVLVLASTRLLAAGLDATGVASPRPLLLAGLGGGMVTSPNVTLTLQSVPVRMAVAAGGRCRPPADRRRHRHGAAGLGLLPGADGQRPRLRHGGLRRPAVRLRTDAGRPRAGHRRVMAAAPPPSRPAQARHATSTQPSLPRRPMTFQLAGMRAGSPTCDPDPEPMRCLIVHDSLRFLDADRGLLERHGMTVVDVASTSADALRRTVELRPDVTLVDIDLGGERPGAGPAPARLGRADSRAGDPHLDPR